MKKIVTLTLLALFVFCAFTISAFAEEATNTAESADVFTDVDGEQVAKEPAPPAQEENIFSQFLCAFEKRAAEIFSVLSFAGSLIIMFCYKKGFLPLLKSGVLALGKGVSDLRAEVTKQTENGSALSSAIDKRLGDAEAILNNAGASLEAFDERLKIAEEQIGQTNAIKTTLATQTEMLYEIFMASSLPQFEKERVGEMISKMRGELGECERVGEK